jgi:flagellar motor switch protein FliN/FliY
MGDQAAAAGLVITSAKSMASAKERANALSDIELHPQWPQLARLPLKLTVGVPLPAFRVVDLLGLHAGQTIPTVWPAAEDVPVHLGGVQLLWCEFEVVNTKMAVRCTRLA